MAANIKFYVGTLEITIGEHSNKVRYLVVANSDDRGAVVLDRIAAGYYGSGDQEFEEEGYYSDGGCMLAQAFSLQEVGLAAFLDLEKILPVRKDGNVPDDLSADALTCNGFKAFAASARKGLGLLSFEVPAVSMLEVLAKSFGSKNWQVLRDKFAAAAAAPAIAVEVPTPAVQGPDDVPGALRTWSVDVCRTACGFQTIEVQATHRAEAEDLALDVAGNYEYSEKDSDYSISFAAPK